MIIFTSIFCNHFIGKYNFPLFAKLFSYYPVRTNKIKDSISTKALYEV